MIAMYEEDKTKGLGLVMGLFLIVTDAVIISLPEKKLSEDMVTGFIYEPSF